MRRFARWVPWVLPGLLASAAPALAGDEAGWKSELAKDLVTIQGDRMVIEDYEVCKAGDASLQWKTRSEAPNDGSISRDNFVALTTVVALEVQHALGDAECREIDTPIGGVDIEVVVHMTGDGLRQAVTDHRSGETRSDTTLWRDVFPR